MIHWGKYKMNGGANPSLASYLNTIRLLLPDIIGLGIQAKRRLQ